MIDPEYYDDPKTVAAMIRGARDFDDAVAIVRNHAKHILGDHTPTVPELPGDLALQAKAGSGDNQPVFFARMLWRSGWKAGWLARTGD